MAIDMAEKMTRQGFLIRIAGCITRQHSISDMGRRTANHASTDIWTWKPSENESMDGSNDSPNAAAESRKAPA